MKRKIFFKNSSNPVFCDVVRKSILTEKSAHLEINKNCLSFIAPNWANKKMLDYAISSLFGANVRKIGIINIKEIIRSKIKKNHSKVLFSKKVLVFLLKPLEASSILGSTQNANTDEISESNIEESQIVNAEKIVNMEEGEKI